MGYDLGCLEDHPRTWFNGYHPMTCFSALFAHGDCCFQMAVSWLLNAGDPNYLQVLG